ncbi:hypothetical protein Tco_0922991 [Tanacetum coccineum]|uniref:Uncharacterized protein n=1 Tax=Tanacetum coccineum TaxID=301880 RepID=A0ABQ5D199_9ASTR
MVLVPIHQDTSSVPPITTLIIDLTTMQSDSPLLTSTATTSIITTTTSIPPTPQPRQSTTDPILVSHIGELEQHMVDLIQNNLALEERLDKHRTRLYNLENLNIPHKVSQAVDEIVTDAVDWAMRSLLRARFRDLATSLELDYSNQRLVDQEEARKMRRKRRDVPRTPPGSPPSPPPPPPPLAGIFGAPDDSIPDEEVHLSDDEDFGNNHLPKADSRQDWWKLLPEKERPATPEPAWTISSSNKSDVANNWASALATTYEHPAENSLLAKTRDTTTSLKWYCRQIEECHKMLTDQTDWTNPKGDQVRVDVNQPLPLGGPPGHITIQPQFFFNKDLEYLRYGSKGRNPALSISKMKAASYFDFGLELLVPKQMWIEDVCSYDISAKYEISHWWFNRQKFYIDRDDSSSRRKDVRTHMRIPSVVRIKTYSRYGYDYLSEIVLRRADFQEHTIVEKDFKNLYPSDFEDLNLLLLQGHLNHLPGSDKRMLSTATQLNLTKLEWDATGYEFKHDYTIIESPRAVIFPVNSNERKIMRFNEIYKFSDVTLTRILEALDYRVKEFKIKRLNPGSGYQQKDRKPSQNDKTEHGMEKTVQNQGQSPKMPKSESIQKNQQSNRSRN